MKLTADKLAQHLARGLAPVYLLYGEEPLGLMECGDQIRQQAHAAGFTEREVIIANEDADWQLFRAAADSLSLFSSQRLLELRMPNGKTGRAGADVLKKYVADPPSDLVLLIISGKLDRGQTSSAWFKAIDKAGVTMAFWPITARQLPRWIENRMRATNLQPTRDAIGLIAERVEGNMLAAQQEIERLSLLYPAQKIDTQEVLASVANSARYTIGDCVEAAMLGASARALRVLEGLREEAVTPVLVLWALAQEIRSGTRVAQSLVVGMSPEAALKAAGVWRNRVPALKLALARHTESTWLAMLQKTALADRVLKGREPGDVWEVLAELCVELSRDGQPVISA